MTVLNCMCTKYAVCIIIYEVLVFLFQKSFELNPYYVQLGPYIYLYVNNDNSIIITAVGRQLTICCRK